MKNRLFDVLRLTLCAAVFATVANAQQQQPASGTVRGRVIDAVTGRPVVGAIVRIGPVGGEAMTRTDETGAFSIANVRLGVWAFDVRRIGYEVVRRRLDVTTTLTPLEVKLTRFAQLDTIQVRAAKQGLYGVVATAKDMKPLPKATLRIMSVGGGPVPLDSNGRFFVPIKTVGSYFMRARAPGYEDQTISVIVSPNEGVEIAFLLDTALKGPNHRLEIAMADFDDRLKARGLASAMIPRSEIMKDPGAGLSWALKAAPALASKGLRWDFEACVYVDGVPKPGLSLNSVDPADVEAVEVYNFDTSQRPSDRTGTLSRGWPKSGTCGLTGMPAATRTKDSAPPDDIIHWVVIWLKH